MKDGLTICLVYHSRSAKELNEINFELTSRLNRGINVEWIAADNSGGAAGIMAGNGIVTIKGADFSEAGADVPKWARASFHHAAGINMTLPHVKTRHALILDADFFIIRQNWISEVTGHMRENNLAFFGAPYSPHRYTKYRYFPCAQCLFIDCEKINLSEIDFTPDYGGGALTLRGKIIRKFKKILFPIIGEKLKIGKSHDTGYKIYQKYGRNSSVNWESVKPVVKLGGDFLGGILPDFFSFEPKNKSSYSKTGFKEAGTFDARANGWEEYMWRNGPFALHLQNAKKNLSLDDLRSYLKKNWG